MRASRIRGWDVRSAGIGGTASSTVSCVMFGRVGSMSWVVVSPSSSVIRDGGVEVVEVVWSSVAILGNLTARFRRRGRMGIGLGFLKVQFLKPDLDIVFLEFMLTP